MINRKECFSVLLGASIVLAGVTSVLANESDPTSKSLNNKENISKTLGDQGISKMNFVYSYDEMLNFDISDYLAQNAPHLLPYAESISHYSGRSSISPKVFITLLELQTQAISNADSYQHAAKKPFAMLSNKSGFNKQLDDISTRLANAFYAGHSYLETGINAKQTTDADAYKALRSILSNQNVSLLADDLAVNVQSFATHFKQLFPEAGTNVTSTARSADEEKVLLLPSTTLLQLPYPEGDTWTYGGSHTHTGSGSYPQSSLDLNNGGNWGSDLSNLWVTAAAAGQVVRHSSCQIEIIHSGGWSTNYYHLSNINVNHGATIDRDTAIANYASNKSQALCQGGSSSGPHVHFSLKKDGQYYHLNGVSLSGYEVHTGRDSYDGNCNYFWLEKNNNKYCAWSRITNPGVDDVPQDPTIYAMINGQVRHNISATKGRKYYYKIDVPVGASDLKIESYSGSGDADMYLLRGVLPTISNYDCRPYEEGNSETCTVNSPSADSYYIMLHAFDAFDGLSLKTTFTPSGTNGGGYTDSNISASNGEMKKYWIDVPTGMKTLTVNITGTNGDADLYVKKTAWPSTSSYDCRSYNNGSNEMCTFNDPEARRWYIGIHAYSDFSDLTLEAKWEP
ncbi:pre-peptidase C-terminal domain-containing protein [Paraglaciecola sp.]|uniref:pre-peptidase C-terminal domain-containing protein n=1 Tax=Paraglaciecola sp. TaxID=1920173 RepID=UPI0030F46A5D